MASVRQVSTSNACGIMLREKYHASPLGVIDHLKSSFSELSPV